MWKIALCFLVLACGELPEITGGQLCPRVATESHTAGPDVCVRLDDQNGMTLFRLSTSEDCGGPPCLRLTPGQTGYVLEKLAPSTPAVWSYWVDSCENIPFCPHSEICDEQPERCGPPPL
jgi:hypothetical protein